MIKHVFACDKCGQEKTLCLQELHEQAVLDPMGFTPPPDMPLGWVRFSAEWQGEGFSLSVRDAGLFCSVECASTGLLVTLSRQQESYDARGRAVQERKRFDAQMEEHSRNVYEAFKGQMPDGVLPALPQPPQPPRLHGRRIAARRK